MTPNFLNFLPLSPISQVIYEVLSNDDFILIFNILFRYRKWLVTFLWAHTLVSGSTVGYFSKYLNANIFFDIMENFT